MFRNNPWQKQSQPVETKKNWIDDYAPSDQVEADYFYDRPVLTAEPDLSVTTTRRSSKARYFIVGAVLLGMAGVSYWLGVQQGVHEATTQDDTVKSSVLEGMSKPATSKKTHTSTEFGVSFVYPASWQARESDGKLTVKSPMLTLTGANGSPTRGSVSLELSHDTTAADQNVRGQVVARDSEKLVYSSPGTTQRAETYISFFGDAGGKGDQVQVLYLTGSKGFAAQEVLPPGESLFADPVVAVRMYACNQPSCQSATKSLSTSLQSWQKDGYATELKSIISSFSFD